MNSSEPCADDRRADDAQSIERASSPGRYGREPATSEPIPRRTLVIPPNGSPANRRRGASGKVSSVEDKGYPLGGPPGSRSGARRSGGDSAAGPGAAAQH